MSKNKKDHNLFLNRELSWINFNRRVLEKALDDNNPLLEQAKFSAIYSNNLDEFFMVRVASLKSQVEAGVTKKSEDNKSPKEQLILIREAILPCLKQQQQHYMSILKPGLNSKNIYLLDYKELTEGEKIWVNNYFKSAIFPVLTPLAVDPAHPFPFVLSLIHI